MKPIVKRPYRCLVIAALLLSTKVVAPAATVTWTNIGTGDFGTINNWNPNQVPGLGDRASIINGGIITIGNGSTYVVSNLFVAARGTANATGTVQITSGTLTLLGGPGSLNNVPQVGNGANALGRIEVAGGTLERYSPFQNPDSGYLFVGGGGGTGYLTVTSGNVFLDYLRVGSDQVSTTGPGTGIMDVSGGLVIVTNQWTIGRDMDTGIINITGGEVINHARNVFIGGANDDHITLAGGNTSTGIVTIATGGTLRAEGGIRISHAPDAGQVANGTLRVNGGKLATQRIFQGGTTGVGIPRIEFDGGILEAFNATNLAGFIYITSSSATSTGLTARLKSGGITVNSAGYDLPVFAPFLEDAGSPGGGIIKSNAGTLKLLGANTYKGATLIEGGGVILATASTGGGAVTANDGTGFGASVSQAGSSLPISTLTLNAGTGTNDLNFILGVLGNPTAPVMIVTNLTVNRTNKVNVSGAGLSVGQFTLVQYFSAPGLTPDQFELNSLPPGISAELVFEPNLIKLNITAAPSLHWNGDLSPDWDTTTANWLDFSLPTPAPALYSDGAAVQFDDGATTNYVNLVQALSPAAVTVTNQTTNYVFAGPGSIAGATGLRKEGAAMLTVSTLLNSYSGDTIISAGTFQLGASDIIPQGSGKGNVVVNGTLDMNGFSDGINGLTGAGTIDNTAGLPSTFTAGNNGAPGSFSGVINNSGGGALTLVKTANNVLTLTGNNSHAGGTTINNGVIQAGNNTVLGTGTLTLDGGAISSDSTAARTFINAVLVLSGSTLGSTLNPGVVTLSGPVDFNGDVRSLTVNSDALLSGESFNGGMNKLGPATLTLQGAHNWSAESEVRNGVLILEGAVTNSAGFRPDCDQLNGSARLVLSSGSAYVLTGSSVNMRAGNDGNTTASNIIDIAGTVLMPNANSTSGRIILGQGGTIAFANLLTNGLAVVREVSPANSPGYCEFNFNGGTLQATADNTTYMQGLSNAFVRAGGAIIDSAGFNITIAQNMLAGGGSGGLTKIGAGSLFLNGNNTYTGSTTVSDGALGGTGTMAGPVLVTSGGTLAPGNSVGTLTINNTLTLQGTTLMELSRDSGTAAGDRVIGVSTLTRGGALVVTNSGVSALRSGDVFDLFDATSMTGSFASVSLPPLLAGLSWNTANLAVDGTISVTGTAIPPQFNSPMLSGNDLLLSGTGGPADGTYYVLTSDDVGLPVGNWTSIATNMFDSSGNFNFSATIDPGVPQRFYLITIP